MLRNPYVIRASFLKFCRDLVLLLYHQGTVILSLNKTKNLWLQEKAKPKKRYAVIISGGPSYTPELQRWLGERADQFDAFAVNFYCLSDSSLTVIPKYYLVSDPYVIGNNKYEALTENVEKLKEYIHKFAPTVICPDIKSWNYFSSHNKLPMCDLEALFTRNIKPWAPRGYTSNTVFKAIAVASYLDYEKIFIVGFDYDYPRKIYLDEDGRLALLNEHHYGSSLRHMDHVFSSVAHALRWWADDYYHLEKLSNHNIYNVTDTSLVDNFARISSKKFMMGID